MNEFCCLNYDTEITTLKNRRWGGFRVGDYTDLFGPTDTFTNVDNSNPNFTRATVTKRFLVGDSLVVSYLSVLYYIRIYYMDTVNNYIYFTKEAAMGSGALVSPTRLVSIVVTDGTSSWHLRDGVDYSITGVLFQSSYYIRMDFKNNFEAAHAGLNILDPGAHQVKYRVHLIPKKHGATLKFLLNKLGLPINSASFDNADTALPVNTNFAIPSFDSEDYGEYYEYIEKILESTLGFLRINEDFEFEYHLFYLPSSTNEINETDIIKKTYSVSIDYNDLIYQFIAYNPHCSVADFPNSSASSKTKKVRYLHNSQKTVRFQHVLEDISTRITKLAGIRAERKALYHFSTKIKNLASLLGDEFKLKKDGILGNDAEKNIVLLDMYKSTGGVNATYQDLKGL